MKLAVLLCFEDGESLGELKDLFLLLGNDRVFLMKEGNEVCEGCIGCLVGCRAGGSNLTPFCCQCCNVVTMIENALAEPFGSYPILIAGNVSGSNAEYSSGHFYRDKLF